MNLHTYSPLLSERKPNLKHFVIGLENLLTELNNSSYPFPFPFVDFQADLCMNIPFCFQYTDSIFQHLYFRLWESVSRKACFTSLFTPCCCPTFISPGEALVAEGLVPCVWVNSSCSEELSQGSLHFMDKSLPVQSYLLPCFYSWYIW